MTEEQHPSLRASLPCRLPCRLQTACNLADLGLISELGRFFGEGNGYPLQYSCLENSMDREALQASVHGVAKSWTRLSDKHRHTHTHTHTPIFKCSSFQTMRMNFLSAYNFKTNTCIFKIQLVLVIKGFFLLFNDHENSY